MGKMIQSMLSTRSLSVMSITSFSIAYRVTGKVTHSRACSKDCNIITGLFVSWNIKRQKFKVIQNSVQFIAIKNLVTWKLVVDIFKYLISRPSKLFPADTTVTVSYFSASSSRKEFTLNSKVKLIIILDRPM